MSVIYTCSEHGDWLGEDVRFFSDDGVQRCPICRRFVSEREGQPANRTASWTCACGWTGQSPVVKPYEDITFGLFCPECGEKLND